MRQPGETPSRPVTASLIVIPFSSRSRQQHVLEMVWAELGEGEPARNIQAVLWRDRVTGMEVQEALLELVRQNRAQLSHFWSGGTRFHNVDKFDWHDAEPVVWGAAPRLR